ncbi:ABC transporter ATP-binding protein [Actinokineospora terrae]|uniref:ABC-2 type transport system ATP-binding protein n=1 Tax=Actinokineospora terrae TaxID=155974 RepID=A0A1H9P3A7_9PSEU|nr:ABC transporter ATP-binding protein [Actinokineospora terrae]SER42547.1 ABC-2 type transport system ATP-binding protein [Actinokineospora terrae]
MTEVLARASGVTRRYGDVVAVDDLSVEIPAGQLLGLLGPNGAGKSTLINMFVGLRKPTSGTVELFGHDPRDVRARRRMGMTPQETGMPETLQAGEVIEFVAAHYPNPISRKELLAQFHLEDVERRQTGGLSGGEKRRLAIALAFVGRPDLVFLDEPTTGLDVEVRRALWDGVKAYNAAGGTAVITSHYLEEIEELAQRVIIIDNGRAVADDSVDALRRISGLRKVTIRALEVPALPGVVGVEQTGDVVSLITADSDQLVRDLVASGAPFADLEVSSGSLEDAFLAYTTKAPTAAPTA